MDKNLINKLVEEAKEIADRNFCCGHSGYTVGAALLTAEGDIFKGFNVENDGIQSICAERVAFTKALTENKNNFSCIVVVGKKAKDKDFVKTLPCGYCRQFMSEYVREDFIIFTYDDKEQKLYTYNIKELLPESFNL